MSGNLSKQDYFERLAVAPRENMDALPAPHPDDLALDDFESARVICAWVAIRELPDRLRRIFLAANYQGKTLTQIGEENHVSRQRAAELCQQAARRLKASPFIKLFTRPRSEKGI